MPAINANQSADAAPDDCHIAEVLQTESESIAAAMATIFLERPQGLTPSADTYSAPAGAGQRGAGTGTDSYGPAELRQMLQENFVRLSYVVSLAIVADEPGVLADDLAWLRELLSWRGMSSLFPALPGRLLDAFKAASRSRLDADEAARVSDVLSRALGLVQTQDIPLP